jgi:hypothetical protein
MSPSKPPNSNEPVKGTCFEFFFVLLVLCSLGVWVNRYPELSDARFKISSSYLAIRKLICALYAGKMAS